MKIIDSNKDFYDVYQYVYPDDSFTFDRRDSYNLSKDEFKSHFYYHAHRDKYHYILLQVCNSFWLFEMEITQTDNFGRCSDYTMNLLDYWKDYNRPKELIKLSTIDFSYWVKNKIEATHSGDYKTVRVFNNFTIYRSHKENFNKETRTIPILQNIGITNLVNPLDIYLAFEEYFSKLVTDNERTESVGLTNDEKITNHGFDTKNSFRGKNK